MKETTEKILDDIKKSKKEPDYGKIGNGVLYYLCRKHPYHNSEAEIIAKVWLIGRSYAASIERNKNRKETVSDNFYKNKVAPKFKEGNAFDNCLSKIRDTERITIESIPIILETHKKVIDFIREITGDYRRSFVSKYLHFHFPKLFFLYDSRVPREINRVIRTCAGFRKRYKELLPKSKKVDKTYADFFVKCSILMQCCKTKRIKMTPRDIDNFLIKRANKAKTRTIGPEFELKLKAKM
jgi:hypothetical protein